MSVLVRFVYRRLVQLNIRSRYGRCNTRETGTCELALGLGLTQRQLVFIESLNDRCIFTYSTLENDNLARSNATAGIREHAFFFFLFLLQSPPFACTDFCVVQ